MSSQNYVACPNCGSNDIKSINYTWWGGTMGPRWLNHVKCLKCGTTFNGKTGKSNTVAIAAILIGGGVLGFALGFALRML